MDKYGTLVSIPEILGTKIEKWADGCLGSRQRYETRD